MTTHSFHLEPLTGLIPPVLTPLLDDHTIDESSFRRLLDEILAGGADALFIGGTAGLGPLLPDAAWRHMMEIAISHVGNRAPLLAGVMETSTPRAIARISILEKLGYQRFVLTPTFYCVPRTEAEFLAHFGTCREATAMEMIAYNIPPCTGSSMSVDTILEMTRRGWIRACKESSGDRAFFADLCTRGRELGLAVFQGNKPDLAWLHSLGVAGIVPVPANVFPAELALAWRERAASPVTVAAHQDRINRLWSGLVHGWDFLGGSIHALSQRGLGTGHMLTPLQTTSPEGQVAIKQLLAL